MITKFERKVIAGLTAVMMCLSMIFAVPISANAETDKAKDVAVSDAQQDVSEQSDMQEKGNDAEKLPDADEEEVGGVDSVSGEETTEIEGSEAEMTQDSAKDAAIYDRAGEDERTAARDAGSVMDIKPGEYEVEFEDENQEFHYTLTVDETGTYKILSDGNVTVSATDEEGAYVSTGSFCKLEKGRSYSIVAKLSYGATGNSGKWSVVKGKEVEVKFGEINRADGENVYYKFVPETTGNYSIQGASGVYDENWNSAAYQYSRIEMTAGKTYYITFNRKMYWQIETYVENEKQTIPVRTGETYTTEQILDDAITYTFTPEETGRYRFRSQQGMSLHIKGYDSSTAINISDGMVDLQATFEKGTTYEITVSVHEAKGTAQWNITKADVKTITEGTEYTTTKEETTTYDFIPDKSGEYMLFSKESGTGRVYDDEWKVVDGYWYDGADEFGMVMSLEKGKTYHIGIAVPEKDAKWKIESVKTAADYTYRVLADNTVEILKYSGNESNVTVPDQIDNKVVKSVGYGAFANNNTIVGVTIPAQVTDLQYGAFGSCANLETVTFTEGSKLQKIEKATFEYCTKLNHVDLPDSVKRIGENGFAYCENLADIDLGNGLKDIERYAFYYSGVESIVIPDSVANMEAASFQYCESLSEVTLGSGLEGIEVSSFASNSSLKQIEIPENITYIEASAFSSSGLTSVEIPDSVTSIGDGAFLNCQSLEDVVIGNGLAYIADSAFWGCALTDIVWGDKVEKIGLNAFSRNKNLTTIEIPNSVTEIEYGAFDGCSNLSEIEIPDSVEAIGGFAFDSQRGSNENTEWYDNQADGDVYAGKVYYKYKGEAPVNTTVTVKDGTKGIAGYSFYMQTNIAGIEIPNSVNNIGDAAFMGCEAMKTVTIPETVKEIGDYAFGYLKAEDYYEPGYKVEDFTIRGVAGSAAETYAKENGFNFEAIAPDYVKGDLTGDEKVDIADVRMTLRSVCQKVTLTDQQKLAADVEKDGTVDIADLRKILRFVCDKIEEL